MGAIFFGEIIKKEKDMELKELEKDFLEKQKQKTDITDRRQILAYDKTYKSYFVISIYGISINWRYMENPNNFILYKLW